jgi:hypothetical protein
MSANIFLPPSPVVPMFLVIASITNANPMVVTTSTPNSWIAGQLAYFSIPFDYGMFQLNSMIGMLLSVDITNLILTFAIDSTKFDHFIIPSSGEQPATMSPAGSRNTYNFVQLPFHSLGDFGN